MGRFHLARPSRFQLTSATRNLLHRAQVSLWGLSAGRPCQPASEAETTAELVSASAVATAAVAASFVVFLCWCSHLKSFFPQFSLTCLREHQTECWWLQAAGNVLLPILLHQFSAHCGTPCLQLLCL